MAKPTPYIRDGERKTKDGKLGWRVRVWDPETGKQPERVVYGTYEEAAHMMETQKKERAAGVRPLAPDARRMKFGTYAADWIEKFAWRIKPVGENPGIPQRTTTWTKNWNMLNIYILPALGDRTMSSLTYDVCYEFIAGLRVAKGSREAAASTKETVASVLRNVLDQAVNDNVLAANPAARLPTRWGTGTKIIIVPSLRQVEALASAMDEEWPGRGDIVRLFAYTALRWEELTALKINDVDLVKRSMHIWATRPSSTGRLSNTVKTPSSGRFVTIIDQAVEPLERLIAASRARNSSFVVSGARGGALSYGLWRDHLTPARVASGVPYTAHPLRHVCISLMIAGGVPIDEVSNQAGHSHPGITSRKYKHAILMPRTELARRMSQAITAVEVEESEEDREPDQG